jgi:2-C-methyl-D-erythritol 4-phosphate cytidylyltransferase
VSVAAVIVAGGVGERFGAPGGKQLAMVCGKPVVAWSAAAFDACERVDHVVLVAHPERLEEYAAALPAAKLRASVPGGATRQDSVEAGLEALPDGVDVVAVHDGARPLVTPETIARALDALSSDRDLAGVVVGHPQFDTVKRVFAENEVGATVDRNGLWAAQTPQVFRLGVLREAYRRAAADGFVGTDDSSLVERIGGRVRMLRGPRENIKVTVPEDLIVVEAVLGSRGAR